MSGSESDIDLRENIKRCGRNSMKYIDESKPFGCENCQAKYMSISALNVHIKNKHEGRIQVCYLCNTNYATYQTLKQHKQSKHEMYRYICHRCPKGPEQEFTADYALKKHTQQQHKKDNLVVSRNPTQRTKGLKPCDLNKVLVDYSRVLKQRRGKYNQKKVFAKYVGYGFKCTNCLTRKRKLSSLRDHVTVCHEVSCEAFEKIRDTLIEEKPNWKKYFGLKKCIVRIENMSSETAQSPAAACSSYGPTISEPTVSEPQSDAVPSDSGKVKGNPLEKVRETPIEGTRSINKVVNLNKCSAKMKQIPDKVHPGEAEELTFCGHTTPATLTASAPLVTNYSNLSQSVIVV